MLLEIRGHNFPGLDWDSYRNVHCGIQLGREPAELVPASAEGAVWLTEIQVLPGPDFRGPAVQGKKGERFVYLTWGEVPADGFFHGFRRAKLMLNDVVTAVGVDADCAVATVDLTDDRGGPRCARLRSPAITIS